MTGAPVRAADPAASAASAGPATRRARRRRVDRDAVGSATDACLAEVTDERGDRPVTEAEADAQADADAEVDRVRSCLEDHGVEDEGEGFFTPPEDVPQDVVTDCDAQDWFPGQGGDR